MLKVAIGVALAAVVAAYFLIREDKAPVTAPTVKIPIRTTSEQSPQGSAPPIAPPVTPETKLGIASQAPTAIRGKPEFDLMIRMQPNAAEAHASFDKEPRDHAWASTIEDRFNRAFSTNVDLRPYSFPSAECRTTRCQIRLVAFRTANANANKAPTDWIQILNRGFFTSTEGQGPPPATASYTIYTMEVDGSDVVMANFSFQRGDSKTTAP